MSKELFISATDKAEKMTIGTVLVYPHLLSKTDFLKPEHFFERIHGETWKLLKRMAAERKQITRETVKDYFETVNFEARGLEVKVMKGFIDSLALTFSEVEFDHYAHLVFDFHARRVLAEQFKQSSEDVMTPMVDYADVMDRVQGMFNKIYRSVDDQSRLLYADEFMKVAGRDVFDRYEKKRGPDEISIGFANLSFPVGLNILAARPGMGKSSAAVQILNNVTVGQNIPTLVFELEMSTKQLGRWMLSQRCKIENDLLKAGNLTDDHVRAIEKNMGRIEQAPLVVCEQSGLNIMQVRARIQQVVRERGPLGLIIIDYLQLMKGLFQRGRITNRENEVATISRELKVISKEYEIPVLALSQLNREVTNRADKKPRLSDLRESGAIEQDADVVVFIHRPEEYGIDQYDDGTSTRQVAEFIVAKNRDGETSIRKARFDDRFVSFSDFQEDKMFDVDYTGEKVF